jgi:phytoene desaturase
VILNPDLPVAYRELLPPEATPARVKSLDYSPSCFLLLAGPTQGYSQIAHHNIHFGRSWAGVFDELIDQKTLMSDPSILVTNPSRSDPSLAPDGKHIYYVLLPTPNTSARIDWDVVGPRYRDEAVARLEAMGYVGFGDAIEVEDVTTPADWGRRGMEAGAPFAAAHSFLQTGPFRPSNLAPKVDGRRVLRLRHPARASASRWCSSPGRLAAERILGKDRTYRSRALRLAEPTTSRTPVLD